MEQRKITVFTSKEQKKTVIMTSATTLAELKSDLRINNINYSNMDFFEGVSKTKLMADDSQLPHDVPFKGATTNELVVMLSDTNKKIKSGATSRVEVYEEIKNKGLQEAVKNYFGRNFTQVPTVDLIEFLGNSNSKLAKETVKAPVAEKAVKAVKEVAPVAETVDCGANKVKEALLELLSILYESDTIDNYDRDEIMGKLNGEAPIEEEDDDSDEDAKLFEGDWMK